MKKPAEIIIAHLEPDLRDLIPGHLENHQKYQIRETQYHIRIFYNTIMLELMSNLYEHHIEQIYQIFSL